MIWFKVSHDTLALEEFEIRLVTKSQIAYLNKNGDERREARVGSGRYPASVYKWFENREDAVNEQCELLERTALKAKQTLIKVTRMLSEIKGDEAYELGHHRRAALLKMGMICDD